MIALLLAVALAEEPVTVPVEASDVAPATLVLPDGESVEVTWPAVLLPEAKLDRCLTLAREEPAQVEALAHARDALVACRTQLDADAELQRLQERALRLERRGKVATGFAVGGGVTAVVLGVVLGLVLGGGG